MAILKTMLKTKHNSESEEFETGVVSLNPRGFGFIGSPDGQEYFLPPALAKSVIPGDEVKFKKERGARTGLYQAGALQVLHRAASIWLGEVVWRAGEWFLQPDEACFVKLRITGCQFIAPGIVVAVRVSEKSVFSPSDVEDVHVERVLGDRSRAGFELDYALARHDFPAHFGPDALSQAEALDTAGSTLLDTRGRADLRHLAFVTIDGESSRDFDDAVWAEEVPEGWHVQVAIADVSFFVKQDSALDREAQARGTSVYLPGRVSPMLPDVLSNGLCSLNPGEPRLALVAQLQVGADGSLNSFRFARAVIRSAARLTYQQCTHMLEGALSWPSDPVARSVQALHALFEVLHANRRTAGMLSFEDAEPRVVSQGPAGDITLEWHNRTVAHKLIEELMLLANRAAALQLQAQYDLGFFRHQPLPDAEAWEELRQWCLLRGLFLPDKPSMAALAALMSEATGREESLVVSLRTRKVMVPALYHPEEPAHFSLSFSHYAHFTSPIRRYADLLVHRLLVGERPNLETLPRLGDVCSERSRRARLAERDVWDTLKKRVLLKEAPQGAALEGTLVWASRKGARVLVTRWQTTVWVGAESFQEEGYAFSEDIGGWSREARCLEPGCTVKVCWVAVETVKMRPEIQAKLCARDNDG